MHDVEGNLTYQPYGKEGQAIYSVSRGGLNQLLVKQADLHDKVNFHFNEKCLDIDLDNNEITFENTQTGTTKTVKSDYIFGADGAFSAVRNRMMRTDRFTYSQTYIPHGYKELLLPANADGTHKIEKEALHIWPRGEHMLIALPNLDGSYTCTLFLAFDGGFDQLNSKEEVEAFFKKQFPDFLELMPNVWEEFQSNPTASLVYINCEPWNHKDKVLLIGDAAHGIVPFYGQGMNAGFEDCTVFDDLLNEVGQDNIGEAIAKFSGIRKKDGDAICELALYNFIEMRDRVADAEFLLRKKIEAKFSQAHPDKWIPLYSQVTFSHIPYSEALARGKQQEAIMSRVMDRENIHENWDSSEVMEQILNEINAL